jgi:AmmeMemoRadiSam system protein A
MHPLVLLAKETIESYIKEGKVYEPSEPLGEQMQRQAGAFVSIKKRGQLRGCIGTIQPSEENLAQEVIRNAIAAATHDPRFPPIGPEELGELNISVDVLTPPEPVKSTEDLDPKRYGVIVECGWRRGLLLPDLEGVDTAEYQIEICRRKAGIGPDEPVTLYRFEVERYH